MGADAAGTVLLAGREVPRLGFGAMRLPGAGVWGPPRDRDEALRVLRRAVELGVRVIDTAWYYGPSVSHELIAEALSPYPEDLVLVTKLGGARGSDRSWQSALQPEQLRAGLESDLQLLRLDSVPVVHLRWMEGTEVGFEDALGTLLDLQDEGKIGHVGLSNVTVEQLEQALAMTSVATVSNLYGVTTREDEAMVDRCEREGIPYLPFFPLQMGRVARQQQLTALAAEVGVSPVRLALAWLLAHSPALLPIPGTGTVAHLEDNVAAAGLTLPAEVLTTLDGLG